MSAHLSRLAIDVFVVGTASALEARRLEKHIADCERCRDRVSSARVEREVLSREVPRMRAMRARPARLGWLRWLLAPTVVASAVAVALLIRPWRPAVQIKGGAAFQIYARHGDRVFPVRDGAVLAPKDQLRFVAEPAGLAYLLVAYVDGAGAANLYVPFGGDQSVHLDPGARIELPGSIVLDSALGPERVFALFSREPLRADDVRRALTTIAVGGASSIRTSATLAVAAESQQSVLFEKTMP